MIKRLTIKQKLLYGFGDTGFSLTTTIIGAFFAIFLTDVVHIDPATAALAIFIGRTWDYINDPIVGYITDRTRTRWGRRRPFLLFGAIPFGAAFVLMWLVPPIENPTLLLAYYIGAYLLFDATFTFVSLSYFALTPELTEDYDERTSLTAYRMLFSIAGGLVAFTVPLMIIGSMRPENASRVTLMAVIFAIVSIIPLWVVFASTRERAMFMHAEQPRFKESLKAALKNRPFIFGAGIFLLTWVSMTILEAGLLYYIKYVVQRESDSDLIMGVIFVTAILVLPFWNWVSHRWNKRMAYIVGIAFWAVVQLAMITLNPGTSLGLVLTLCVLAGIGVGAAHVLPWSILPDAIEWDEYQTGERHEGIFYSLVTLFQKIATSIAIPLVLVILDLTNYIPNAAEQPASALTGIRIMIGPIPALLLIGGILFAALYPLSRGEYSRVVAELESRRATGGAEAGS